VTAPLDLLPQLVLFENDSSCDALGDAFCLANDAQSRRVQGITLTPAWLVERMLDEVSLEAFDTIVDCGAGTGRFTIAAARRFPKARVVAVEQNPELIALLRQRLSEFGLNKRVSVVEGDFREVDIPRAGRTLFLGNPPYVRHHDIAPQWKQWYAHRMAAFGVSASRLAGLHAHFMLRSAELMQPGDALCFVTSAEWLDNGYGSALRALLARGAPLSLQGLWTADGSQPVFADALVSSVVLRARCGAVEGGIRTGMIDGEALRTLHQISPTQLAASARWSAWCRPVLTVPTSGIELGELFRVTRGQVTGLNAAWVLAEGQSDMPRSLTVASVTRAKELIDDVVASKAGVDHLRRVAALPADLDAVPLEHREAVTRFLERAKTMGADQTYIARHRKPWHAVDMRAPPAAFVSYMGRRPPVFRANPWGASFINIAHGLYSRQALSFDTLTRVLQHLNHNIDLHAGRMYGGGMAKFEPGDIARLRLPAELLDGAAA
jgi:adenine-specific DNA-methyltransferase